MKLKILSLADFDDKKIRIIQIPNKKVFEEVKLYSIKYNGASKYNRYISLKCSDMFLSRQIDKYLLNKRYHRIDTGIDRSTRYYFLLESNGDIFISYVGKKMYEKVYDKINSENIDLSKNDIVISVRKKAIMGYNTFEHSTIELIEKSTNDIKYSDAIDIKISSIQEINVKSLRDIYEQEANTYIDDIAKLIREHKLNICLE